jgi:hypothetical protein
LVGAPGPCASVADISPRSLAGVAEPLPVFRPDHQSVVDRSKRQRTGDQIIRKIIKWRTAEALGASIPPQVLRTSAATTFVLEHPEHAMEASTLRSNTDFSNSEQYYLVGCRQMAVQVAHQALTVCPGSLRGIAESSQHEPY